MAKSPSQMAKNPGQITDRAGEMADRSGTAAMVSAVVSIVELVVLVVGGIAAYYLIQRNLTSVDLSLKTTQADLAALQKARESTPNLKITADHSIEGSYSNELQYLSLNTKVTNVGLVPLTIKTIAMKAFEGRPDDTVSDILIRGSVDETPAAPAPVPTAPSPVPPEEKAADDRPAACALVPPEEKAASDQLPQPQRDSESAEKSPPEKTNRGKLYSVSTTRITWNRQDALDERNSKQIVLQPGQERSVRFGFVFEQPKLPLWYRFIITVETSNIKDQPPADGPEIEHIVRLGPFPLSNRLGIRQPEVMTGAPAVEAPLPPPPPAQ